MATSNQAVELATCTVCACEVLVKEDGVQRVPLQNIPNFHRLVPKVAHPNHKTWNGRLLAISTIHDEEDNAMGSVCSRCWKSLSSTSNKPPDLSLANQMWIGPVPWQLQVLTFLEQLLIALVYPCVFVFKLYPKRSSGQRVDPDMLQWGMKGNVSSYEMNMPEMVEMIQGNLMPRPIQILASLVAVTFIRHSTLPSAWLRSTFHIQHHIVFKALMWLKENNLKYYGEIIIDPEHMTALPEDDVPLEIMATIHQEDDEHLMAQESAGYVPSHETEEGKQV
ncbi:hypothetical protein JB92DRAFT_3235440 [Gautieria morchelliformis]|nr:hypothetical protein JB92DRAFT_3235440 [Gautieria morchelliformis]